jgi:hypothetical protein
LASVVTLAYFAVGWVHKEICTLKIAFLGKALVGYTASNDGKFPPADKWCDVLVENLPNAKDEWFRCPAVGDGRCHYAMNSNAEPNSPPDTVLLFESKPGWNQFGGPELLTTDHHRGKGCNVTFVGTGAQFVKKDQLGDLKWK